MGKLSRRKGQTFERKIAKILRERFPQFAGGIRRSIQSREAEESDVTGIPGLWLELQHAAVPTPNLKLIQAIRDVVEADVNRLPVAITHKTRTKSIEVTMRAEDLVWMYMQAQSVPGAMPAIHHISSFAEIHMQLDFDSFLDLVEAAKPWTMERMNG